MTKIKSKYAVKINSVRQNRWNCGRSEAHLMAVNVVQSGPTQIVVTHVQDIISYFALFILDVT